MIRIITIKYYFVFSYFFNQNLNQDFFCFIPYVFFIVLLFLKGLSNFVIGLISSPISLKLLKYKSQLLFTQSIISNFLYIFFSCLLNFGRKIKANTKEIAPKIPIKTNVIIKAERYNFYLFHLNSYSIASLTFIV